jgi:hypothetical protein
MAQVPDAPTQRSALIALPRARNQFGKTIRDACSALIAKSAKSQDDTCMTLYEVHIYWFVVIS